MATSKGTLKELACTIVIFFREGIVWTGLWHYLMMNLNVSEVQTDVDGFESKISTTIGTYYS